MTTKGRLRAASDGSPRVPLGAVPEGALRLTTMVPCGCRYGRERAGVLSSIALRGFSPVGGRGSTTARWLYGYRLRLVIGDLRHANLG